MRELFFAPVDGALLGLTRLGFGALMALDCFVERGLQHADRKWSDEGCQFPLFNFMKPLSMESMIILQFIQGLGALAICLGYRVKRTGWLFILPYWYMFLLDKTHWNNHSYLFGLMGIIFTLTDSDAAFSISSSNKQLVVPMWNYYIVRFQIFLLYFYAGLKKTEADWLLGYSMGKLSRKWVFDPFRPFLTNEQIDRYIVHLGGFALDMTSGPFLLFDRTRPLAIAGLSGFHLMNSQMFSIGMFPYACLATMFIFCRPNSPRSLFRLPQLQLDKSSSSSSFRSSKTFGFFWLYALVQLILPYSHCITRGYNGWTQGAYGYSWDMMIHSFSQQHIKITYEDGVTGKTGYLKPNAFMGTARNRWTMHPDMLKQYATCVARHLEENDVQQPKLYFDVWKSMNERFYQRVYDPRVDIVSAEWSWNTQPIYIMPLLSDLSDWRSKLKEMEKEIETDDIDVTFVADYPGLELENYLSEDLDNTTIELMGGDVYVTLDDQEDTPRIDLTLGEPLKLPAGQFHTVHATGDEPVMYMYIYQNTTDIEYRRKYKALKEIDSYNDKNEPLPDNLTDYFTAEEEAKYRDYFFGDQTSDEAKIERKVSRNEKVLAWKRSWGGRLLYWLDAKTRNLRRGSLLVYFSLIDLASGKSYQVDFSDDEIYWLERLSYMDQWTSPFKSIIKSRVDEIVADENILADQKDEL